MTISVATVVPFFSGFYNSFFEEYWSSKDEVGQYFVNNINDKIKNVFPSFSYTFERIQSPKYYNYGTDEIYASATFDKDEVLNYLKSNINALTQYCRLNFSHSDGFISYLPSDEEEFINGVEQLPNNENYSSYVFGFVCFALEQTYGQNVGDELNESTYYDCAEQLESDDYELGSDNSEEEITESVDAETVEVEMVRKPSTIEDLKRTVARGFSAPTTVVVEETIPLSFDEYNTFVNNFSNSFKWLEGKGGTSEDGVMSVVKVTAGDSLGVYVNPEGYDYARYVALVPSAESDKEMIEEESNQPVYSKKHRSDNSIEIWKTVNGKSELHSIYDYDERDEADEAIEKLNSQQGSNEMNIKEELENIINLDEDGRKRFREALFAQSLKETSDEKADEVIAKRNAQQDKAGKKLDKGKISYEDYAKVRDKSQKGRNLAYKAKNTNSINKKYAGLYTDEYDVVLPGEEMVGDAIFKNGRLIGTIEEVTNDIVTINMEPAYKTTYNQPAKRELLQNSMANNEIEVRRID